MSRIDSEALLVRTVDVGESDVIATLVTEQAGKVSAIVRGARRGSRRIGGALEPVHTVAVMLEDRGGELTTMKEARIVRTRPRVVESLDALEAAGVALRWARHLFPPRTPEPQGWSALIRLLDALDGERASPKTELARVGLALLAAVGYGLELERCVVCGRQCPKEKPAGVDPRRGGLVCRSCGGASAIVSASVRAAARALVEGPRLDADTHAPDVNEADARVLLQLVDRSMAAHAGFER
ncbi:MAG: DNA repair protein RecO [Myxococcota bacterium]|nr:DNA repair protein RecO [Myxococcota bacterium]